MGNNALYKVSLTDLGTYTADIVANSPEAAVAIAKEQLWKGFAAPRGFDIQKRETDGTASLAMVQPPLVHTVTAWHQTECALEVPAHTEAEAAEHFRRLLDLSGPIEAMTGTERLSSITVTQCSPNGGHTNA